MHINFAPRNFVKFAAHCIVYTATSKATETLITETLIVDSDSSAVETVAGATAGAVTVATWNRVDNAVDRVAHWMIVRKVMKAAK